MAIEMHYWRGRGRPRRCLKNIIRDSMLNRGLEEDDWAAKKNRFIYIIRLTKFKVL